MKVRINEKQREIYEKQGWWTDRTLLDEWESTVKKYGEKEYVVDNLGCRMTYAVLDHHADILASFLYEKGVRKDDMISLQCTARSEFIVIVIACLKLGAVIVPMKMRTGAAEWVRIAKEIKSKMHFCVGKYHNEDMHPFIESNEKELEHEIINVFIGEKNELSQKDAFQYQWIMEEGLKKKTDKIFYPKADANDVAAILFTSGTTSGSKGVLLTHNNICSSERIFNKTLKLTQEDIIFMPAPLSHATGFHHGIISSMLCGGKIVLLDCYHAKKAMEIMEQEKCTFSMGATPFIYDYLKLMDEGIKKPSSLKFYICGGAPVPYELTKRAWKDHKLLVCECYGSTESVPHVIVPPEKAIEMKGCWSGIVMEGIEVRIVNDSHEDVAVGEIGEEISRGPNVFVGYLNDKENTNKVLDKQGWYYSGDLCYGNGRGSIKICGRKKDIIVRGGENLNINEIEESLQGCPGILDAAIIGMKDERLGERVCAFVIPKDQEKTVTKEEISAYLASKKVSKWLWPERVEAISKFPYTESGKIKRYELKKELEKRMEEADRE